MPVQKNTSINANNATSAAAAAKGGAGTTGAKKPSTRDTLKKATPAKKSSSTQSNVKKSPSQKVTPSKGKSGQKTATKKRSGKSNKSTSELLVAIKAVENEALESTEVQQQPLITPVDEQTSTKAKGKAPKPAPLPIVPPMQKALEIVAPSSSGKIKARKASFGKRDLDAFREELITLRDRFTQQTKAMMYDALQSEDGVNSEEDGTDAFMRLQVLNQMGSQQRVIADIDEALNDITTGAYGICEMCECLISKLRLKARPFARFCIKCKSEMERADRFNKPR